MKTAFGVFPAHSLAGAQYRYRRAEPRTAKSRVSSALAPNWTAG
jgi:hypothetical protein